MSKKISKILDRMKSNPEGIKYKELEYVCDHFFEKLKKRKTSHQRYKTPWAGDPRVNIQPLGKFAKIYQVKQVLRAVDRLIVEKNSLDK